MNKKFIKLTEADLHRIVKESVDKIVNEGLMTEGEKWIGEFDYNSYNRLLQNVKELNGNASFSLNGTDFTIVRTERGFRITSGVGGFGHESFNIESALKVAWIFSNQNRH